MKRRSARELAIRIAPKLAGILLGVAFAAQASAQEMAGARVIALSDSQRALGAGNDAVYVNPGGLALSNVYSLEANYLDDLGGLDRRVNVSILDSQSENLVAGEIAYTYGSRWISGEGELERNAVGHRVDVGLGAPIANGAAIGATVRYLRFSEELGGEKVEDTGFTHFTADFGFQLRSDSGFGIGAAVYNIFNHQDEGTPPLNWGGGVGYDSGRFSIEVDLRHDLRAKGVRFSGGAGVVLSDNFILRGGGAYDRVTETGELSAGFGYGNRQFGVEIGYRERVSGEDPLTPPRTLAVGLRAYFF